MVGSENKFCQELACMPGNKKRVNEVNSGNVSLQRGVISDYILGNPSEAREAFETRLVSPSRLLRKKLED